MLDRSKVSFCRAKGYSEMDGHISDEENADIDWNTDDELEIQNIGPASCTTLATRDAQAIISNGEALDNSPEEHNSRDLSYHQQEQCVNNDELSSDYDESLLEELSESDSWSWSDSETENGDSVLKHEKPISDLISMGFTVEEALSAMERCGPDAPIAELTDMIYAAQMAKADAVFFEEEVFTFLDDSVSKTYI
ncbi:putative DNA (cytosine-5-)-methyltransferase [Helianthus debilis subsp. tardiflorus]